VGSLILGQFLSVMRMQRWHSHRSHNGRRRKFVSLEPVQPIKKPPLDFAPSEEIGALVPESVPSDFAPSDEIGALVPESVPSDLAPSEEIGVLLPESVPLDFVPSGEISAVLPESVTLDFVPSGEISDLLPESASLESATASEEGSAFSLDSSPPPRETGTIPTVLDEKESEATISSLILSESERNEITEMLFDSPSETEERQLSRCDVGIGDQSSSCRTPPARVADLPLEPPVVFIDESSPSEEFPLAKRSVRLGAGGNRAIGKNSHRNAAPTPYSSESPPRKTDSSEGDLEFSDPGCKSWRFASSGKSGLDELLISNTEEEEEERD
jgi:hypothetical protein